MTQLNITPEQIQAAMEEMTGASFMPEENPLLEVIEHATAGDIVHNVIKVSGGELRCIVSADGDIKPTTIIDGATTQMYDKENDIIAWVAILNGGRHIFIQDKDGIIDSAPDAFNNLFGNKTGYALSYLSSFNGDNNILLDDEKVQKFNTATKYAEELIGSSDAPLKTLISSMCTNTDDFQDVCQTWNDATIFDNTVEGNMITWGCRVETEKEYIKFESTYVVLWVKPMVMDHEEDTVPDELVQIITRQVNPDKVPGLGWDSKANFLVDETLNDKVLAYAVITEDSMDSKIKSIELFKTSGFEVNANSF